MGGRGGNERPGAPPPPVSTLLLSLFPCAFGCHALLRFWSPPPPPPRVPGTSFPWTEASGPPVYSQVPPRLHRRQQEGSGLTNFVLLQPMRVSWRPPFPLFPPLCPPPPPGLSGLFLHSAVSSAAKPSPNLSFRNSVLSSALSSAPIPLPPFLPGMSVSCTTSTFCSTLVCGVPLPFSRGSVAGSALPSALCRALPLLGLCDLLLHSLSSQQSPSPPPPPPPPPPPYFFRGSVGLLCPFCCPFPSHISSSPPLKLPSPGGCLSPPPSPTPGRTGCKAPPPRCSAPPDAAISLDEATPPRPQQ